MPPMRPILSLFMAGLLLWATGAAGEERRRESSDENDDESASDGEQEESDSTDESSDENDDEDRRLRVVVLEVEFSEGVRRPLQERLQASLVEALNRQSLDVVEPETVEEALRPLGRSMSESCRAGRCVGWILEVLDGDAGLVAHIDAFESSYSVTLNLLGPYGGEIGRAERRCDICTFDELADSVAIAGRQLSHQIPRRVHVGRLGIFPTPEDAAISVDGVAVGRGSLSLTLPVGLHVIEARLSTFQLVRREIMMRPDDMLRLEIELERAQPVVIEEEGPDVRRPVLWSTATFGIVAALTGVIMMGIHGSCRDDVTDSQCTSAFSAGISLLSVGLGMSIVSGVALALFSNSDDE